MSNHSKYWPLDYEPEGEIYDNPAWDLPGFRKKRRRSGTFQQALSANSLNRPQL